MIARPYWDHNPEVSISNDRKRAVVDVDLAMLENIMSQMRLSLNNHVNSGRYTEALEMLQAYLKLEEMYKAWLSMSQEDRDNDE